MSRAIERHDAARLLETAAAFVLRGWTKDLNARRADGSGCAPDSPEATCWCAQGALTAASHELGIHVQRGGFMDPSLPTPVYEDRTRILNRARAALREAIVEAADKLALSAVSVTLCITTWNDHAQSGAVVERTMRRASELLGEAD